jgi:hypothetical protein
MIDEIILILILLICYLCYKKYKLKESFDIFYKDENDLGFYTKINYPNNWIEKLDEKGNPIYKNIYDISTNSEFVYNFSSNKLGTNDGIIDKNQLQKEHGKTIKEIYDSSFTNFKILGKKEPINNDNDMIDGASNLKILLNNDWKYNNEKPHNGGEIINGLYAFDESLLNSVASF